MENKVTAYGRLAQAFHWVSAILIIGLAVMGIVMTRMSASATQTQFYRAHVTVGMIVLVLTLARVIWHFMDDVPDPPAKLTSLNTKMFVWNHNLLYVILFVLTISGIATLLSSGIGLFPGNVTPAAIADVPPRGAHNIASKVFILLFIMHVVGIIRYQLTKGDTLSRMGIKLSS